MNVTRHRARQKVGLFHRFSPPPHGRQTLGRSVVGAALRWLAFASVFVGATAHATPCERWSSLDEVLDRVPLVVEVRLSPSEVTRYQYFHDQPPPPNKASKRSSGLDLARDAESRSEARRFETYLDQIKTQQDDEGLGLDERSFDRSLEVLRTFKGDPGGGFIRLDGGALVMPEGKLMRPGQVLVIALINREANGQRPVWATPICTADWPYFLRQGSALYKFKLGSGPRIKQRYSGYAEFAARFFNPSRTLPTRNPGPR